MDQNLHRARWARRYIVIGAALFVCGMLWLALYELPTTPRMSFWKLRIDALVISGFALFFAGMLLHAQRWFSDRASYYCARLTRVSAADAQVFCYRVRLMDAICSYLWLGWIVLVVTVAADIAENELAWRVLIDPSSAIQSAWVFTALKFAGFFALLGGSIFAWMVKRSWLIKAVVTVRFEKPSAVGASASARSYVLDDERDLIERERPDSLKSAGMAGLAISGGGIRSATFALGVLQGLAKEKWLQRFDYLSSVSGGGYLAGALHALKKRCGAADLDETVKRLENAQHGPNSATPLAWLRRYSNYLSPSTGFGSGDSLAMLSFTARGMLLSVLQFLLLGLALCVLGLVLLSVLVKASAGSPSSLYWAFGLAAFSNAVFVFMQQTQANAMRERNKVQSDAQLDAIWTRVQLALLTLAAVLACAGLWPYVQHDLAQHKLPKFVGLTSVVVVFVGSALLGFLFAYLLKRVAKLDKNKKGLATALKSGFVRIATTLAGACAGAACIYGILYGAAKMDFGAFDKQLIWLTVGPLLFVLAAIIASALQASFSAYLPNFEFALEYSARVGGRWFATVLVFWLLPALALLYAPQLLDHLAQSIPAALTWLLASGALLKFGFSASSTTDTTKASKSGAQSLVKRLALALGPALVIIGLVLALSVLAHAILKHFSDAAQLSSALAGECNCSAMSTRADFIRNIPIQSALALAAALLLLWCALSAFLPIHRINLGMLYRNRLVRAYLGASNTTRKPDNATNFDFNKEAGDDLALSELQQRPFPLLGAALNLIRPNHDQLDWQDRKAAPFVLSPLYCGYMPPLRAKHRSPVGDKDASEQRLAKELTLGDAIAISGAAANPAMGYHSRPDMAFLLAMINVRLGQWVANRCATRKTLTQNAMRFSGAYLLREAFGGVTDETDFVHLSDGGHFDNLGLFELVRRRVPLILCIDGSQDQDYGFADLSATLQRCRIDLGVDIPLDPATLRPTADGFPGACFVHSKFYYDAQHHGELIYLKAGASSDMPLDAQAYRQQFTQFPHQSTGDQFFDEVQFEVYRMLGLHLAGKLLRDLNARRMFGYAD
jgi:hypothetical protein